MVWTITGVLILLAALVTRAANIESEKEKRYFRNVANSSSVDGTSIEPNFQSGLHERGRSHQPVHFPLDTV